MEQDLLLENLNFASVLFPGHFRPMNCWQKGRACAMEGYAGPAHHVQEHSA
jgi:hypothetical protein